MANDDVNRLLFRCPLSIARAESVSCPPTESISRIFFFPFYIAALSNNHSTMYSALARNEHVCSHRKGTFPSFIIKKTIRGLAGEIRKEKKEMARNEEFRSESCAHENSRTHFPRTAQLFPITQFLFFSSQTTRVEYIWRKKKWRLWSPLSFKRRVP